LFNSFLCFSILTTVFLYALVCGLNITEDHFSHMLTESKNDSIIKIGSVKYLV
jgi:hypothetical protein